MISGSMAADRVSIEWSAARTPLTKKVGVPLTPAAMAASTSCLRAWPVAGSDKQASICGWVRPLTPTAPMYQSRASPLAKAAA
ncbi:hypothetical protein D3C80_1997650 [compost metagenome]